MKKLTKTQILHAYRDLYAQLGKVPASKHIRKSQIAGLEGAIYREFGNLSTLRATLNIKNIRNKKSHWTIENVLKEIKHFCSENKCVLETRPLSSLMYEKRSDLYDAAQRFGGLNELNISFDLGLKLRRSNYWTEKRIIEELKVIHDSGYKITDQTLRSLKRHDLSGAISRRGSITYFKKKAGLNTRKDWSKREIVKVYTELYNRLGVVPTAKHLRQNRIQGMESAIYKTFGGLNALRAASHIGVYRNPPGHWTIDKTVQLLKTFCIKNKTKLRTRAISPLLKQSSSTLYSAVNELGGFKKLNRQFKLGLKLESDDWTEKEIISELKKLLPTGTVKNKAGLKKITAPFLRSAITKKLQLPDFRRKLGLPLLKTGKSELLSTKQKIPTDRKHRNYWTLENTVNELKSIIDADPTFKKNTIYKLRQQKKYNLVSAIYKHKGLRILNKKFDLHLNIKGKALSKKEATRELKMLHSCGVLITQANLNSLGRNDLLVAMNKFGGLNAFKYKLGLAVTRQNYWTDEKIIKELKPIVASFGRIPSENVLKAMGRSDLASAIEKYGRVKKFSRLLNIQSTGYFKANDGHYLNSGYECLFDNILFKYNVPHHVNERICPTFQYRYDFLIGDTYIEICGYSEKEHPAYFDRLSRKIQLYEKLNLKHLIIRKKFFSKKFDEIERETVKLVAEISSVKPLLNSPVRNDIVPDHYWKNIKNVKKELLPLVKKYGRIPFDRELRKERKASLIHGVYKYHGSFYDVGEKLHLKTMYKPKGFYTLEMAIKEYKLLCIKHKRFLSQRELQQKRCHGLMGYISRFGGLQKIRALIDL